MKKIHLYLLNINTAKGMEEYLLSILPEERVRKAKNYVRENDRLLSLCAGYLISRYIGAYRVDPCGKPRSDERFFSVSHSGELVGLAVSEDRETGLDIEKKRAESDFVQLAEYCFCKEELELFNKGADLLALFTAKESLAKAEGGGLAKDIKTIPALPPDGKVEYGGRIYYRHSFETNRYVGSVTQEHEDFIIETTEIEVVKCCSNNY